MKRSRRSAPAGYLPWFIYEDKGRGLTRCLKGLARLFEGGLADDRPWRDDGSYPLVAERKMKMRMALAAGGETGFVYHSN